MKVRVIMMVRIFERMFVRLISSESMKLLHPNLNWYAGVSLPDRMVYEMMVHRLC